MPFLTASQFRQEAELCRDLARRLSLREDAAQLLAMARLYEARAVALEARERPRMEGSQGPQT